MCVCVVIKVFRLQKYLSYFSLNEICELQKNRVLFKFYSFLLLFCFVPTVNISF